MIWNGTTTKKIPGIRIGRRVVSTTNCVQQNSPPSAGSDDTLVFQTNAEDLVNFVDCTHQENANFAESWFFDELSVFNWYDITDDDNGAASTLSGSGSADDYTTTNARPKRITDAPASNTSGTIMQFNNAGTAVTWTNKAECDFAKWENYTTCNGIEDPWGMNSQTFPDGQGVKAASGRWFRWLADDTVKDKKAVFSVERDDEIYVVVYEKWGRAPANNDASSINLVLPYDKTNPNYGYTSATKRPAGYLCNPETSNWGVGYFVV